MLNFSCHNCYYFTFRKRKIKKIQMKMLNGFYYLRNIVQNGPKTPKNFQSGGRPNTFFSLVTTTVISRYSCKTSKECFKFLKTLRNISKIGIDCQSNTKFHKIRWGTALKNNGAYPQNVPKIPQNYSQQRGRYCKEVS